MLHICFCIFPFAVFCAYNITIFAPSPIICQENHLPIRVLLEIISRGLLDPADRATREKKSNSLRAETWPYSSLYPLHPTAWHRALPLVDNQQVFIEQMTQCKAPSTKIFTRKVLKFFLLIWIKMSERWDNNRSKEKIKSKTSKLSSTGEFLNRVSMPWSHVFAAGGLSRTLYNFCFLSHIWMPVVYLCWLALLLL